MIHNADASGVLRYGDSMWTAKQGVWGDDFVQSAFVDR